MKKKKDLKERWMEESRNGVVQIEDQETKKSDFEILKSDDDKRLVFGWASIIQDENGEALTDRQKDVIEPDDLEEAAYEYVLNFRDTGEEHLEGYRKKGKLVESCVFTEEKQKAMGLAPGTLPVGWWIGFYIEDDDAWQRIKNGTYRMFSIEGRAERVPIDEHVGKGKYGGCGVIVRRNGKILVGTRIESSGKDTIGGPGGNIKHGETPKEAAIRETLEEFNIECDDLKELGTIGDSTIFLCEHYSGTPKCDEVEMTNARWMDPKDIDEREAFVPFYRSLKFIDVDLEKGFDFIEDGEYDEIEETVTKSHDIEYIEEF